MKSTAVALILLVFVSLCAVASAQEYAVRVTHNTNLRTTYSLQGRIVETAPAGTVLHVSDAVGKWLKISRNNRDMWMADWVGFTRVDGTQLPPNIDNCCFVDRQCNSDQEWADGYWAFQNGQCAAPASVEPMSSANPADVDNCCFLSWQCNSDDDWQRGYQAYQSNSCAGRATIISGIRVEGTEGFKALVNRALNFLQTRAPHWYQYAITGLNAVIEVNPPEGHYTQGVIVESAVARFNLASPYHPIPEDDMTMAEYLVHEACHVHRYRAGLEPGGYPGEKACIEMEAALWQELAPNSKHHNRKLRYLANIHRRECQHWLPPVPGGCTYW